MSASRWSDKVEKDMLFAALASNPTPINWNSVAATMAQQGHSFSASAIAQPFNKMRRQKGTSQTPPTTTPSKNGTTPSKSGRSDHSFAGRLPRVDDEDDDDDDDDADKDLAKMKASGGKRLFSSQIQQKQIQKKIKKEGDFVGFKGQTRTIFKKEGGDERDVINLDNSDDDLYDA